MTHVWIVEKGEFSEGGEVVAVCSRYPAAIRAAKKYMKGNHWAKGPIEPNSWECGCDWLTVKKYKVDR